MTTLQNNIVTVCKIIYNEIKINSNGSECNNIQQKYSDDVASMKTYAKCSGSDK